MATIQLTLPDQQLSALQSKAETINLTVDELIRQILDESLISSPEMEKTINYVLDKNRELYKRLA